MLYKLFYGIVNTGKRSREGLVDRLRSLGSVKSSVGRWANEKRGAEKRRIVAVMIFNTKNHDRSCSLASYVSIRLNYRLLITRTGEAELSITSYNQRSLPLRSPLFANQKHFTCIDIYTLFIPYLTATSRKSSVSWWLVRSRPPFYRTSDLQVIIKITPIVLRLRTSTGQIGMWNWS